MRTSKMSNSQTWIWYKPSEILDFGTTFDYKASLPATGYEIYSDKPVDASLRPVYKSRSSLKRFKALHCPPFSDQPIIDTTWRDIILKFIPEDRIQFLPVILNARGETCEDFMYAIPFDRRICIDVTRSNVVRKTEKDGLTLIWQVRDIVHHENCLAGSHMARDPQYFHHLVISNELKEALAATGEDSVFWELSRVSW